MTLTQVATITRRLIFFTIFLLITGTMSLIGYNIWYTRYLASIPPPPELPDTKFGLLALPDLPLPKVSSTNFSYSIDTVDGFLPQFKNIQKVFFSPKSYSTFLSSQKAKKIAEKFNIVNDPEILSEIKHRFTSETKSLEVELDNGNFSFTNQATISAQPLPDQETATSEFKGLLSELGVPDQLKSGPAKVNVQDQLIQISLWPVNLEEKSVVTADFNQSLVSVTAFGSLKNTENILSLKYIFWPIDTTTFATYPIKTTNQALDDLKSGQGTLVIAPDKPQVSITSAYLAYYMAEKYQPFIQPIYVFEGSSFVAYIPAIVNEFFSPARQNSNSPTQ